MTTAWLFPGQGSQHKGMGEGLFGRHRDAVALADRVLGYSIEELCTKDPHGHLRRTEFVQPALFVVGSLAYREATEAGDAPAALAGHSLGEYVALFASGAFDFETGLRLVKRRGELMGSAAGGSMAAVIGVEIDAIQSALTRLELDGVEIANINAPDQIVVSGSTAEIDRLARDLRSTRAGRTVPLAVNAAFHSSHMEEAASTFAAELPAYDIGTPTVPVIANATGQPYRPGEVRETLGRQMRSQVRWSDSMRTLQSLGVDHVEQIGPGTALVDLWQKVRSVPDGSGEGDGAGPGVRHITIDTTPRPTARRDPAPRGYRQFCDRHGADLAYASGSMYGGIASTDLVEGMARSGMVGFFGSATLSLSRVEAAIDTLQARLAGNPCWGMNLLAGVDGGARAQALVDLYLRRGVRLVEASAFTRLTPSLIEYRFRGASIEGRRAVATNRVIAKVSRRELAVEMMSPPPAPVLRALEQAGRLSPEECRAASRLPVAADICVEADSGGHTDGGVALALLPHVVRARDELLASIELDEPVCIGAGGGIGSPEAIAAATVLGADFIVTGSINQCTREAGTSDHVKDLLLEAGIHDTAYAPAGDMFELGARVQVLKKGTLFASRANQLYNWYRTFGSLEHLPLEVASRLEDYLGRSLDDMRAEVDRRSRSTDDGDQDAAPRRSFAATIRSYFERTLRSAIDGDLSDRVNFQIHTGPALGAYNDYARGTAFEHWRDRRAHELGRDLMERADKQLAEVAR